MRNQKYSLLSCIILTICYLGILSLSACSHNPSKKIDISKEDLKINPIRFDEALFACDTNNLEQSINDLGNKYPDFSAVFFTQLTGFRKGIDDPIFYNSVRHFLTYKDYKGLMDTVRYKFPNTKETDLELEDLFKHIHYYYPKEKYQTVYYFVSGLNYWKAVTIDSIVGVGLDMFLGKDYPFYASVQIPAYQALRCEKKYIPVFTCKTIYEKMFPIVQEDKTLLDMMLQNGKELLFMEYCLPDSPEEDLIGYTSDQLKWCKDNEGMVWSFFSKKNLLYATQWQEIMRYVNEGPTSTGMPAESPGNIGSWIGWQIIKKYWTEHPEKTLQEILSERLSSQKLLEQTKYKPR